MVAASVSPGGVGAPDNTGARLLDQAARQNLSILSIPVKQGPDITLEDGIPGEALPCPATQALDRASLDPGQQ